MPAEDPSGVAHLPKFHYALAAVTGLGSLLTALPVGAGWNALLHTSSAGAGGPSLAGWIFLVGGGLAIVLGLALTVALAVAGRAIAARRHHGLCVAVAVAATFFFPLGTLLGFHAIDRLSSPEGLRAFGLEPRRG